MPHGRLRRIGIGGAIVAAVVIPLLVLTSGGECDDAGRASTTATGDADDPNARDLASVEHRPRLPP